MSLSPSPSVGDFFIFIPLAISFVFSTSITRDFSGNNIPDRNFKRFFREAMKYEKVKISGINTADLCVLTDEEKEELLIRAENGDKQAKDKLVLGNLKLVLSVIQHFNGRGPSADDLFEVGTIGLIKAINRFDRSKGFKLSSYCHPMILGEIKRFLRDDSPIRVSRSLKDLAYKAMQTKEALIKINKTEPTIDEIANELGEDRADVVTALESVSDPVSLYEPVFSDSGDTLYVLDQIGDNSDDESWLNELSIKETIAALSQREKKILNLRYFQGKTQVEVAKEIGISQAQVSRLEKGALDKIKEGI